MPWLASDLNGTRTTILINGDIDDWPRLGGVMTIGRDDPHNQRLPNEVIRYQRRNAAWLFDVTRGYNGTPAKTHVAGAPVRLGMTTEARPLPTGIMSGVTNVTDVPSGGIMSAADAFEVMRRAFVEGTVSIEDAQRAMRAFGGAVAERCSWTTESAGDFVNGGDLLRCEREPNHEGRHHVTAAARPVETNMYWSASKIYTLAEEPRDPFRRPRKR